MKRLLPVALIGVFAVAGTLAAAAADVPLKAGEDPKAGASAAPGDLKAELPPAQYNRVVKPIEAKIEAAEKIMKVHDKEKEKDAEKRNARLLLGCKTRAAEAYLGASLAAKKAINLVKTDGQKTAIKEQYEEPNRKKAIDIFAELAGEAYDKGDLRMAVGYYKRILAIDKKNKVARDELTKIAKEFQEAKQSRKRSGSKSGGSDDLRSWDRPDYSRTGRRTGRNPSDPSDWSKTGRGRGRGKY